MEIFELRPFQDHQVVLRLKDGETLKARVVLVDMEYEDIIVDVVETTQPEHYKLPNASYTIPASDILTVAVSD